ncbi:MAG: hypothetical protein O2786_05930 [archaeon]|nr:hypothetical protein [archaeon]
MPVPNREERIPIGSHFLIVRHFDKSFTVEVEGENDVKWLTIEEIDGIVRLYTSNSQTKDVWIMKL